MTARSIAGLIRSTEYATMGAILMISVGLLAIFMSIATGIHPTQLSAWIFVVCGGAYFVYAYSARDDGEALWRMLTSLLYLFVGIYLLLYFVPELKVRNLIFVVATTLLVDGAIEFLIFYRLRLQEGSGWIAAGAFATIFLAILTLGLWPVSSMRIVGGIAGTKFVISGVSRLMYSLERHKKLEALAKEKPLLASQSH